MNVETLKLTKPALRIITAAYLVGPKGNKACVILSSNKNSI